LFKIPPKSLLANEKKIDKEIEFFLNKKIKERGGKGGKKEFMGKNQMNR
jgi:hypothetical protein